MNNVFLVFGYGIPKDIMKDENYAVYLRLVFNTIYDLMAKKRFSERVTIIFSGGKTDLYKPFNRTEAEEMIKLFKQFSARPLVKNITKNWALLAEKRSLSTLENFLYCKEMLVQKKFKTKKIHIFCEQTRTLRIKKLSKKIFEKYGVKVIPIDFDTSEHRYLDPAFLAQKEKTELKHSLWALKNHFNLEKHHKVFKEKLALLKKVKPEDRQKALKKWWEDKLNAFM